MTREAQMTINDTRSVNDNKKSRRLNDNLMTAAGQMAPDAQI
jgi:hypothetical protein